MILTRLILGWGEAVRHAIVSVDAGGAAQPQPATSRCWSRPRPPTPGTCRANSRRLIDELAIEASQWSAAWRRSAPTTSTGTGAITLDFLDIAMTAVSQRSWRTRGEVDRRDAPGRA